MIGLDYWTWIREQHLSKELLDTVTPPEGRCEGDYPGCTGDPHWQADGFMRDVKNEPDAIWFACDACEKASSDEI